jgi:hypothetical protein
VHSPSLGRGSITPLPLSARNAADHLEFCGSSRLLPIVSLWKSTWSICRPHFTLYDYAITHHLERLEEHATSFKRVSTWGSCCRPGQSAERQPSSDGKPLGGGQGPYLPLICHRKSPIEECQDHSLPRFWISGHVCRKTP